MLPIYFARNQLLLCSRRQEKGHRRQEGEARGGSVPQEPGGAEATARGADGQEQDSTPGPMDLRAQRLWEQNVQGWGENQDSLRVGSWGNSLIPSPQHQDSYSGSYRPHPNEDTGT